MICRCKFKFRHLLPNFLTINVTFHNFLLSQEKDNPKKLPEVYNFNLNNLFKIECYFILKEISISIQIRILRPK